jgi:hypothetical protein
VLAVVASVTVGLGLIALAFTDVLLEVLHYDADGPVTSRNSRLVWRVLRILAHPLPRRWSDRLLGAAVPLMIATTVITWAALLIVGFALLYLPGVVREMVSTSTSIVGEPAWLNALYLSGAALSTVGFGDITASEPIFQILTVVQSLTGFGLLTLAVTFMLNVQEVLTGGNLLMSSLRAEAMSDEHDDAVGYADIVRILEPYFPDEGVRDLDHRLASLYDRLLTYREHIHRYPFVYYYRSLRGFKALPTMLYVLGGIIAVLRWGVPQDHSARRSPYLKGLSDGFMFLVDDVIGESLGKGHPDELAMEDAEHLVRYWSAAMGLCESDGTDPPDEIAAFISMTREARRMVGAPAPTEVPDGLEEDCRRWHVFASHADQLVVRAAEDLGVPRRCLTRRDPLPAFA